MTVAIAITNYNHGRFLETAITSALGQTTRPDEVIVVDDESTDSSNEILQRFTSKVQIVRQRHAGVVAARNLAIEAISSTHIVFLDADDYLMPHFLRWTLAAWHFPRRRRIGLVYCPARAVGDGPTTPETIGYVHTRPWDVTQLAKQNFVMTTSLFLRRALLDVGGYSAAYSEIGHEDWDLVLKFVERGWHGRLMPNPLFCVRNVPGSRNKVSLERHGRQVRERIEMDHAWVVDRNNNKSPYAARMSISNLVQTSLRSIDARRWSRDLRGD